MITFQEMKRQHVAQVAELEKLCFTTAWSENSIAGELNNDLSLWYVALLDGKVVGYIGSQTCGTETDMMNVAVHPEHRRKGIAESLIDCLVLELKNRGSCCLALEVRVSNAPALGLYEKLGFSQIGRRPNYYRNPREDALILRKEWEL